MDARTRYELIRPILIGERTVEQVEKESGLSGRTLRRYLSRLRESGGKVESLADKPYGSHSHPNWFTKEHKDLVVNHKLAHSRQSSRQIAKALTDSGQLTIS